MNLKIDRQTEINNVALLIADNLQAITFKDGVCLSDMSALIVDHFKNLDSEQY